MACETKGPMTWTDAGRALKLKYKLFTLRRRVAALCESARGHESNGTPPGAPVYARLYEEARALVTQYGEAAQVSPEILEAKLPALCELKRLSEIVAPVSPAKKAFSMAFIAILASAAIGLLVGLGSGVAHWMVRLLGG